MGILNQLFITQRHESLSDASSDILSSLCTLPLSFDFEEKTGVRSLSPWNQMSVCQNVNAIKQTELAISLHICIQVPGSEPVSCNVDFILGR